MRANEEQARAQFNSFLGTNKPLVSRQWSPGAEPPDYFIDLDGTRFAVEVSILSGMVGTPAGQLPEASYFNKTDRLRVDIQTEAEKLGILSGCYAFWFDGPVVNPRRNFKRIRSGALNYIDRTQAENQADSLELIPEEPGLVTIKKLVDSGADLCIGGFNGPSAYEGQFSQQSHNALSEKLTEKAHKLRNVPEPKILLADNRLQLDAGLPGALDGFSPEASHRQFYEGVYVLSPHWPIRTIHVGPTLQQILR